jgi:hypothetical protein
MKTMTIMIERKLLTITVDGQELQVEELGRRLAFGRKPTDIHDIAACGDETVYVTETVEMQTAEFDAFAMHLYRSHDWLAGKGGHFREGRLCVEVCAPGRPFLYVDPSGGDYPRYVARLG